MAAQQYEVEIKCLLGNETNANAFKKRLTSFSKQPVYKSFNTQLNHYFEKGNPAKLYDRLNKYLTASARKKLKNITEEGNNISVRTREINGAVRFVVKASIGGDSSSNGVIRIELEESVNLSLDALDKEIIKAGYAYQAKWSRQRDEYQVGDITVCLDKNAGYGYLVEFEKVLKNVKGLTKARNEIVHFMNKLEVSELPQSYLEKMFQHYNKHWEEYYGTNRVFDYSKI